MEILRRVLVSVAVAYPKQKFGSGSGLKLVSDSDPDSNPDSNPDSYPDSNPEFESGS